MPDLQTSPYWNGAREGRLMMQRCPDCDRLIHPGKPCCDQCLLTDLEWVAVSGKGVVRSLCVVAADVVPGYAPPYVVADVSLDEQPSVVLTANILNARPEDVGLHAPVRVVFEDRGDVTLPQFVLASGQE